MTAPASRGTPVTNSQLQSLLLDLAPLPQHVEELRKELIRLRDERQTDREAAIRVEECLAAVKKSVDKMTDAMREMSDVVAQTQRALAELQPKVENTSRMVWGLVVPVILVIISMVLSYLTK